MKTISFALTLSLLATPVVAKEGHDAAPDVKSPIAQKATRINEFTFDTYHAGIQIVRTRSEGKAFATFSAEPFLIDPTAQVVFEVRSVAESGSVLRWRCVARTDVAECLGAPLKVRYLDGDTRIVLTAHLRPRSKPGLRRAVATR